MIFNPRAAGALRWRDALRSALPPLGVPRWLETEGPGHAAELADEVATAGADLLVVGGGDGTVHEVANGLLRSEARPPFLPLPLGTGNDFVRSLCLPLSAPEATRLLRRPKVRWIDAGQVNGSELFVNSAGFGFDAEVVRRRRSGGGGRSYTPTVLWTMLAYRPGRFEVASDERRFEGRAASISVLNGPFVGGGYAVAPAADPEDGWLDVCVFEPRRLLSFAWSVWKVRRGRHTDLPVFHTWRSRRVSLRGDVLAGHLDGEYRAFGTGVTVTLQVIPRALPVLA